jgi:hypothetical protein
MSALVAVETLNVRNIMGFRSVQSHHLSISLILALRLVLGMFLNILPDRIDREAFSDPLFMSSSAVLSKTNNSSKLFDIPIML